MKSVVKRKHSLSSSRTNARPGRPAWTPKSSVRREELMSKEMATRWTEGDSEGRCPATAREPHGDRRLHRDANAPHGRVTTGAQQQVQRLPQPPAQALGSGADPRQAE